MGESRREMYKNPVKNKDLKIDVNFDITMLDLMCSFIVSSNKNIRRGNIINMRNLFAIVNMNNYYREAKLLFASHSFSQAAKTIEKVKHFETNLSFLFLWGYSMYMVCLSFDRLI